MRDHATDVVSRLGASSWLCPSWSFSSPPASVSRHAAWWVVCKDRSNSNDEKVLPETMYFATPRYKR